MLKISAIAIVAVGALLGARSPDEWSAALRPSNGSAVAGSATAEGVGTADSTLVKISIRGGPANATLPWHIHNGSCAAPGAVLGGESSYPSLQTGAAGTADARAVLAVRPAKAGGYAVQVHRGSDVISCGDLRPVLNKTPTQ